jgi:hypothetical protein
MEKYDTNKVKIDVITIVFFFLGTTYKEDQRLYNLLYRKSKLESVNETSALLSGFAIVSD